MEIKWLKPQRFMTKVDLPKVGYTYDEMTAMIQRLERTKKRSGQVKKAKIQIIIDEFKQYRKEIE
jgi:hypothetical protein